MSSGLIPDAGRQPGAEEEGQLSLPEGCRPRAVLCFGAPDQNPWLCSWGSGCPVPAGAWALEPGSAACAAGLQPLLLWLEGKSLPHWLQPLPWSWRGGQGLNLEGLFVWTSDGQHMLWPAVGSALLALTLEEGTASSGSSQMRGLMSKVLLWVSRPY